MLDVKLREFNRNQQEGVMGNIVNFPNKGQGLLDVKDFVWRVVNFLKAQIIRLQAWIGEEYKFCPLCRLMKNIYTSFDFNSLLVSNIEMERLCAGCLKEIEELRRQSLNDVFFRK